MGFSSAALAGLSGGLGVISKYAESEVKNQQELDLKKQIMAMEEEKALRMDEIKRQRDSAAAESERLASGQAIKEAQAATQAKTTENVAKENKAISGALNDVSQSQDPEVRGKLGAAAKLYADYESKSAKDRGLDEGTTGVINKLREAGRTKEANEFEQDRAREDGLARDSAATARAEAQLAAQEKANNDSSARGWASINDSRTKDKRAQDKEEEKNVDYAVVLENEKNAAKNPQNSSLKEHAENSRKVFEMKYGIKDNAGNKAAAKVIKGEMGEDMVLHPDGTTSAVGDLPRRPISGAKGGSSREGYSVVKVK